MVKEDFTIGLNEDQKFAFNAITKFLQNKTSPNDAFVLKGYAGTGKLQPLTEPVLTPEGWKTMGNIKKGSLVMCPVSGHAIEVLEVFPQEGLNIYKVTFEDGTWVECCDDHLWKCATRKQLQLGNWSVRTLKELIKRGIKDTQNNNNFSIPLTTPLNFTKKEMPLHPYLLGLLLGDGYFPSKNEITLTTHEDDYEYMYSCCEQLLPWNVEVRKRKQAEGTKARRMGFSNEMRNILFSLGLLDKKSKDKFVPVQYLYNTVDARMDILAGLLDTDGCVLEYKNKKKARFSTMSVQLKDNVCEIIRSLGGVASVQKSNRDGEFSVNFRLPFNPFRLSKKRDKYESNDYHQKFVKKITNIEFVRKDRGQCILVDSSDHLYITRDYTVTHNTTTVKRVVQWINQEMPNKNRIAITAPTNKAVRVLYEIGGFETTQVQNFKKDIFDEGSYKSASIQYCTVHKLLGLTEKITNKGEQKFVAKKGKDNDLLKYDVLIVDECSMLNDELCAEIQKFSNQVKIVYTGDGSQIPPVNKIDCIPFRTDHKYNFLIAELREIMRQKEDNPIIEISFQVRNNLQMSQPIPKLETRLNTEGHGVVFMNSNTDRQKVRPLLKEYFGAEEFKEDGNYMKVIAWRNKVVNYYNTLIRELIYGTGCDTFVEGERLITMKPIFHSGMGGIMFNTSEELLVTNVDIAKKRFSLSKHVLDAKVYSLDVESYDPASDSIVNNTIEIIHEDSAKEYREIIDAVKEVAKAVSTSQAWVNYYAILKWSANVGYNYAITAHKSQGSTYRNLLLVEEDIDTNRKVVERNRIKYTSYSRPTDKLFILRQNYE